MQKQNRVLVNFQLENGMVVPSLAGRLFCSRRDPVKESEAWYKTHEMTVRSAKRVLVMGLGAGFHLIQFDPQQEVYVLELNPELIQLFLSRDLPIKPKIHFITPETEIEATVLEFRPAWLGCEKEYEALSRRFRHADASSLQAAAEKKDLWILSEVLKNSTHPTNLEMTVKDITKLFPLENQTQEAKIWRALQELVL